MMPEPGPQKPMPYLRRHGAEEVVDLLVGVDRDAEVDRGADLGLDQVVAVDRRGHGRLGQAGGHELQQRHLGGGVLHGDAVGVEVVVAAAPLDLLAHFAAAASRSRRRSAALGRPFAPIFSCSFMMPWISASGRGGQPGTYTSTGTISSTPWTIA